MATKKIRYLLEERGRFYYQRKVPKALEHYIGSSRWHIPVGGTFDAAQTAVAKLRTEHDALIAKAKGDPTERTKLRREKDKLHAIHVSRQTAKDLEYRDKVLSGEINDPEEIAVAEYEQYAAESQPFWTRTNEYLKVTCAPKTPPDLCRVRPTKGRTHEGTIYGRTDHIDDQGTGIW